MYLINLPHHSTNIPKKFLTDYIIDSKELEFIVKSFADLYTDTLYNGFFKNNTILKSDYSRIFLDVERFFKDEDEIQFQYGMGWYYTKSPFSDKIIRNESSKYIVKELYLDYHKKFELLVEEILKNNNTCSIIDCHSFSNDILYFQDKNTYMPEICIGFEKYHQDEQLIEIITNELKDYEIQFNSPYSGSIVPLKYYKKDNRVKSTMIEINKKLYINENTFKIKEKEFKKLQKHINQINKHMQYNI